MALILPDSAAETLSDGRRMDPSAARNAEPILEALTQLDLKGRLLELAAGSGFHAAEMAETLGVDWHPTDVEPSNFPSIRAWTEFSGGPIRAPQLLDATVSGWSADRGQWDVILLVNLLHLITEEEAETLFLEVSAALAPNGTFCLYGPFLRDGEPTSPGDRDFDASIRAQDPTVGYKDLDWAPEQLEDCGLEVQVVEMPANNLMLLAKRPD